LFLDEPFANTPTGGRLKQLLISQRRVFLASIAIDGTGRVPPSFMVPPDTTLQGRSVYFQALEVQPTNHALSPPTSAT
jgi:hypothetical protein